MKKRPDIRAERVHRIAAFLHQQRRELQRADSEPAARNPSVVTDPALHDRAHGDAAELQADWDYVKMQPNSSRLFLARLNDGLTVFDVDANEVVATVDNSVGANGPLLLPQYNRGYIAMTSGSLLSVDLETVRRSHAPRLQETAA